MSTRAELSETLNRLLPGEQNKRIREAILASASYSGSRTDQLRRSIEDANRIKTGLLVNGTLDITTTTNADLQNFAWVVDFVVRQQASLESITIDAPDPYFPRPDIFVGLADGSIVYRAGTVDAEGNAQDPTYNPATEVLLRAVTRNPDNTFTAPDPGAGGDDNVKKSATGTQTIQSNLAIAQQAGGLLNHVQFDNNGKLQKVRADKAVNYNTLAGTVGWAKVATFNLNIPNQLNYSLLLIAQSIEENNDQFGLVNLHIRLNTSNVVEETNLSLQGKFNINWFKLVRPTVNTNTFELYFKHGTTLTQWNWTPIKTVGQEARTSFWHRLTVVGSLPFGTEYNFKLIGGNIQDIFAGTNITIDKTDPLNPIINSVDQSSNAVSYIIDQSSKTEIERQQARDNIDVMSRAEVTGITGELINLNTADKSNLVVAINQKGQYRSVGW